ncbi:MAG: hypothetical protein AB7I27_01240 [Bacteriovoracaceae bacterium]
MHVYYSEYQLTPRKAANRLSDLAPKKGLYLKCLGFADYFPHESLGDQSIEEFLDTFKDQKTEYAQKVLHFLKKEPFFYDQPFLNHQLWDGTEEIEASVVKYKLKNNADQSYLDLINKGIKVRLDANGLFDPGDEIPSHELIEYIEDPMKNLNWNGIKAAQDFIQGAPYQFYIHKPNARFLKQQTCPVIFSSYLGSDLGKWLSYCELVEQGDINLYHGIITKNFYQEENDLFQGNYKKNFKPTLDKVKNLFLHLEDLDWKYLGEI